MRTTSTTWSTTSWPPSHSPRASPRPPDCARLSARNPPCTRPSSSSTRRASSWGKPRPRRTDRPEWRGASPRSQALLPSGPACRDRRGRPPAFFGSGVHPVVPAGLRLRGHQTRRRRHARLGHFGPPPCEHLRLVAGDDDRFRPVEEEGPRASAGDPPVGRGQEAPTELRGHLHHTTPSDLYRKGGTARGLIS